MADDDTSTTDQQDAGTATGTADQGTDTGAKPEVPPEVKRALSKANKEAETLRLRLKEYEDRDKTEQQKLEERATAAEKAAADAATRLLRYEVAAEAGIDSKLATRLQGSTREELLADAEELKNLGVATGTGTSFDGGARTTAGRATDMNDLIRRSVSGGR